MSAIAAGLKGAWQSFCDSFQRSKEQREMRLIAKAFNDRYTYRVEYAKGMERLPGTAMGGINPRGGYAWMCPECNKIHHPKETSVFSGLQYPRCCATPEGNRLNEGILLP